MKTFTQKEGLNFSNRHPFGDPQETANEFEFFIYYDVGTVAFELQEKLYYRITEDNYIQVASNLYDDSSPQIIAQFKNNGEELKTQLQTIMRQYFEGMRYFIGFPSEFIDGTLFSKDDFNNILQSIKEDLDKNRKKANQNPPELFTLLEKHDLDPQPDGMDAISWLAICPRCRKHLLSFKRGSLSWRCGYCNLAGDGEKMFEEALLKISEEKSIKLKSEREKKAIANQQKLSSFMKKINGEEPMDNESIKWWMNRY